MENAPKIGYARVSTEDQNLDRQIEALTQVGVDRDHIFTDKVSGKNTKRPGFEEMMRFVRRGDCLYVVSMDRLSRSLQDLLTVTTTLRERGVYRGRKPTDSKVIEEAKRRIDMGVPVTRDLKVGRSTLYRRLKAADVTVVQQTNNERV